MYQQDYGFDGFEWLVVDDSNQSVFAIERKGYGWKFFDCCNELYRK